MEQDPSDNVVARLCIVGTPVSEELHGFVTALEAALQHALVAHEGAERRLRLQRDSVDDDLAVALAACRCLEAEKLMALSVAIESDAEVFQDEPSVPADTLTLKSLRDRYQTQIGSLQETHRAQIEALREQHQAQAEVLRSDLSTQLRVQKSELSQRYFAEVQELSIASAQSVEKQEQGFRARDAERTAEVERLQQDIVASAAALGTLQQALSACTAENAALRQQVDTLTPALHAMHTELSVASTRIHMLLSSSSWRASRPLRGVGRVLRRFKGR